MSADGDVQLHQTPIRDAVEVSEDEMAMSVRDKLQMIDQEVRLLHQFCIEKGYNPRQIQEKATPLLDAVKKTKRKKCGATLLKLAVLAVLVSILVYYDPAYRAIRAYSRLASIQILPHWDWSKLYNEHCLIENPYYTEAELTEEDCLRCENLTVISRVSTLSQAVMADYHLKQEIPVIVTDAMTDWPAMDKFNVKFLDQLYSTQDDMKRMMPCMFDSDVNNVYDDPRVLLPKVASGKISQWYAHWENCDKLCAKVIRQFYHRPYFVPPMVEMADTNWIFVASQYNNSQPKIVNIARNMVLFAQLHGSSKIQLLPKSPCNTTCSTLYCTLHRGEILAVTDVTWRLEYIPTGAAESIAVGIGGLYDF
ncbi:hypothetical protein LSAT2_023083 [Lamellibrachia satsuma]|nr:hypothetical protein LSAT2_023083 [Lamellibrachia satsuma]